MQKSDQTDNVGPDDRSKGKRNSNEKCISQLEKLKVKNIEHKTWAGYFRSEGIKGVEYSISLRERWWGKGSRVIHMKNTPYKEISRIINNIRINQNNNKIKAYFLECK